MGLLIGIVGALAVVLGAFGAHGLKEVLPEELLASYNTGIRYHFYHVITCLIAYLGMGKSKYRLWSIYCFLGGIVLFSGSIYLLSCRSILGIENYKWLGPITPIGGLFFIIGWILLGVSLHKIKK